MRGRGHAILSHSPEALMLIASALVLVLSAAASAAPAKVTVCHVAPGNPAQRHEIEVGPEAVAAHLAHGDSLGACAASACTTNADCDPEDYCAKPMGDCAAPGSCEVRPDFCTTVFMPVCGCDGVTYSNACEAASEGVNVAHDGPC